MRAALLLQAAAAARAAATAAPRARLHYFDIRGLAESVRLALAEVGVEWEEVAHTAETWKEAKPRGVEEGLLTFGQVPALEYTDGEGKTVTMVQSLAILQFLGRRHGLYGDAQVESDEQLVRVDVAAGGVMDVKKRYGKMAYAKAADQAKEMDEYKAFLGVWLPYFERLAPARGLAGEGDLKGGDFITGSFTFADVLVYDMLDTNVLRVDPEGLAPYPKLRALKRRIEQRPAIAAYLASPRRRGYANGASAGYDTPANPPPHLAAGGAAGGEL